MAHIQVTAGKTLLEGYVKTPAAGLCELVWNAFDEDAHRVTIEVETGALGGIDLIRVLDDGNGMTRERSSTAFSKVGDSWKLAAGTQSAHGRPVHGRYGRGRYAAFSLGDFVRWVSTAEAVAGEELETIRVQGMRASLDDFEIDVLETAESTGTTVEVVGVSEEAIHDFDELEGLRQRLLTEFALHLDRHTDFNIEFLGATIEPSAVIAGKTLIDLKLPVDVPGAANLTIIEWTLSNVERRLYLCDSDGVIVGEIPPGIQSVGAEFTAYLQWEGFVHDQNLLMEGDTESAQGKVLEAARVALRAHLAEAARKREADTVKRWQAEGVYPYKGKPRSDVERAARDTFNVVAMAASRTVDEAKSRSSKALALSLLKETFENDPEALLPILRQFSQLPQSRIDELKEILEHTTLTQLISVGKEIGDRVDFLHALNALLFDRRTKRRLLERKQLHRILAHETWVFGEEWSLTGDDERLTQVLKKFLAKLGHDIELAEAPIVREDGSVPIPDLVLGRKLETYENHFAHLVVELKRPNHKLDDDDVTQLRSYASAITNDERFDQPNVAWEFWLVGNETTKSVDEQRQQTNQPFGVAQSSSKYKLIVHTWAELIGDAEHRLKFIQRSLQYESSRDAGLASLRDKYAAYLPAEVVIASDSALDLPTDDKEAIFDGSA